ncbi:hypothetical protein tinsulaeT_17050 [Thalassotalea insulae]|uniref:SnoaL-like domain-containing protein n=1 Tax=Thalassotalea insulae TaxID=2056778 RepID=A0ABQ6GUM0_9GAMM|nr:nuclear transport factor 2 family protein [Thalassotalea insulae]GLX78365.1 hypothetical protein tinsulaeT_17050 [Thalassotalea insulae]
MKKFLTIALLLIVSNLAAAKEVKTDLNTLAQDYFTKMMATQAPNATAQDIENFLALMTDDVGSTHLPYVTDDSRQPDGKAQMRQGMSFYLGAHTEYSAKILNTFVFNDTAIAVRYRNSAKGIHPQNKQPINYTSTMMDVLEIENGKIAVIRKYHE